MMKLRKESGFSLVELMIVVAIIAILAAIAIPSFMRFAMKSKTAEVMGNLKAIKTCQESYRAENDEYLACAQTPDATAGATGQLKIWPAATVDGVDEFLETGFEPDGDVRYYYTVAATSSTFTITGLGDLDDDNSDASYALSNGGSIVPPAAGVF